MMQAQPGWLAFSYIFQFAAIMNTTMAIQKVTSNKIKVITIGFGWDKNNHPLIDNKARGKICFSMILYSLAMKRE